MESSIANGMTKAHFYFKNYDNKTFIFGSYFLDRNSGNDICQSKSNYDFLGNFSRLLSYYFFNRSLELFNFGKMIIHKIMLLVFIMNTFIWVFSLADKGLLNYLCRVIYWIQGWTYIIFFVVLGIKHLLT